MASKFEKLAIQSTQTFAEASEWMAPELKNIAFNTAKVSEIKHLDKADIFSLGLLCLYCLDAKDFSKHMKLNENSDYLHEKYLIQFKTKIPNEFYYLIKCMLSFDINTRPSLDELGQVIADILEKVIFFL